jgi:pimeloyl-ACP methyl ester carboxylesterase
VAGRPELASRVVLVAPAADVPEGVVLPRHLPCPVSLVRGESDPPRPRHWAERLGRASGEEPVTVPGSGHALHHDDPAVLAAIIVRPG